MIPGLQALIDELHRGQGPSVGVYAGNVHVIDVLPGCLTTAVPNGAADLVCDRFKLIIPYGGKTLKCEVVFFGNSMEYPPDIFFDDKSFSPKWEEIESFANWRANDKPDALLRLVSQLIRSYAEHQVTLLMEKSPHLHSQYVLLTKHAEFTEESIKINVLPDKDKGLINFLVNMPVVFSNIPPVRMEGNPGDDSAVLMASFPSSIKSKTVTQLFLSPRVEKLLGNLHLPVYRTGDFVNYALDVRELLQDKIDDIVMDFKKKKEYFSSFLSHFGRCLLEYDSVELSYIAFLLEWESFFFVLHIRVSEEFPKKCPVFVFQSTYNCSHHRQPIYTVECKTYPYNPHWTGLKMAEAAQSYIKNYVPDFQKQCMQKL